MRCTQRLSRGPVGASNQRRSPTPASSRATSYSLHHLKYRTQNCNQSAFNCTASVSLRHTYGCRTRLHSSTPRHGMTCSFDLAGLSRSTSVARRGGAARRRGVAGWGGVWRGGVYGRGARLAKANPRKRMGALKYHPPI